jgi:hypothetical protein
VAVKILEGKLVDFDPAEAVEAYEQYKANDPAIP